MTTTPPATLASHAASPGAVPAASATVNVLITVSPAPVTSAISSVPWIGMKVNGPSVSALGSGSVAHHGRTRAWVAARHDAGLHRRRASRLAGDAVGAHARLTEERVHLVARGVLPEQTHRQHGGAERVDVVGRVGGAAEPHLAIGEAQDEDRGLAGDARGLAVEIFVGDEIAHHHHAAAGEAGPRGPQSLEGEHVRPARRSRGGRGPTPPRRGDPRPRGPASPADPRGGTPTPPGRTR